MMMPRGMFNIQLRCYSAPFYSAYDTRKAHDLNNSGKVRSATHLQTRFLQILLPASALDTLVRMNIKYPMLFSLTMAVVGALGRKSGPSWMRYAIAAYVEIIRNTPFLVPSRQAGR